jgi:hypothetical protein
MKKAIVCMALMLTTPVLLTAQYSGGNGRGDASLENQGIPVANNRSCNPAIPVSYKLQQNYPNPFVTSTIIKFMIPKQGHVKIVVYDVVGREVQILVNETLKAGAYETSFNGSSINNGVYFYRIYAGNYSETKRMIFKDDKNRQ